MFSPKTKPKMYPILKAIPFCLLFFILASVGAQFFVSGTGQKLDLNARRTASLQRQVDGLIEEVRKLSGAYNKGPEDPTKPLPIELEPPRAPSHQFGQARWFSVNPHDHGFEHLAQFEVVIDALDLVRKSDLLLVEVGANMGHISYYFASRGYRVKSFEAYPNNAFRIKQSIQGSAFEQMEIYSGAVSDTTGEGLSLDVNMFDTGVVNGQVVPKGRFDEGHPRFGKASFIEIKTLKLDDVISEDVGLLKIDVEGFEFRAMRGAQQLLTHHKVPFIHSEFSPIGMRQLEENPVGYLQYMSDHGYAIYLNNCGGVKDTTLQPKLGFPCGDYDDVTLPTALLAGTRKDSLVTPDRFESFVAAIVSAGGFVDLLMFRARDWPPV